MRSWEARSQKSSELIVDQFTFTVRHAMGGTRNGTRNKMKKTRNDKKRGLAEQGYVMEQGRVVLEGEAGELRDNEDVKEFYLGTGGGHRRSFKNLKSYKRRKRWL